MPRTYWDYLQLPDLLTLQDGFENSEEELRPDELHFILVHQTMELWRKLLLSEARLARDHLAAPLVEEERSFFSSSLFEQPSKKRFAPKKWSEERFCI